MAEEHDPYLALRFPDYRRLLFGNVLSSIGYEMQSVAVGWELYERTESAFALGLVGLVLLVPMIFLLLPAGHAADRYDRRMLLVLSQVLITLTSVGLAIISFAQADVAFVYVCLAAAGVCRAYSMPARWSLVSHVVPNEVLPNAVIWNSSGFQLAATAGPALGGAVIGFFLHAGEAYVLAGMCTLACAVVAAGINPAADAARLADKNANKTLMLESLWAGVVFVWRKKLILATITLDLFAVLFGGATALLPIYAKDILQIGPVGLGWLRAAPSLGAIVMAVMLMLRPPMEKAGYTLAWAVVGFGAATVVFGFSTNPFLSFLMLALIGAFDNISVVVRGTLVQVLTPDIMRGRVSAVNALFINSSNQLGAFESGVTAALFGPVLSVVGGGIGAILVVIYIVWKWPEILRLGRLESQSLGNE